MDTRHFSPGEILRRARLERGISLEEVESTLKVRVRYLQALETDDYASLPPSAYLRGLVQQYARFLGLDPKRFVDAAIPMRPEERNPIRAAVTPLEKPPLISLKAIATFAVVAICAGLLLYLYVQYNSFAQSVDLPDTQPSGTPSVPVTPNLIVSELLTPEVTATSVVPPTSGAPPTPAAAIVVDARILDPTYMQVWTDGTPTPGETLEAGQVREFAADQNIKMRVGNAGGVDVTVNGVPKGLLGSDGQALDATWSRQ